MRKLLKSLSTLTVLVLLTGCAGSAQPDAGQSSAEKNALQATVQQLTTEKADLEAKVQSMASDSETLKADGEKLKTDLDAANARIQEFTALEEKYQALSLAEADAQLAATERKAEEERIALEKIAAEEAKAKEEAAAKEAEEETKRAEAEEKAAAEEAKKAEAEAKKGYETGITFNQLARTPNDFIERKVKFTGEVIQVIDGSDEINLRVAVNGDYDKVVLVYYPSTLLAKRVLEDDKITLYGISKGLYTYESTMGGEITVPLIQVDKVTIK